MKQIISGICVLLAVFLALCGAGAAAWSPVTVTDADGTQITIAEYPERIISLSPTTTEIIYAIGAGDRLVGDTTYCNYPEAAKSVEKIGEFSTINRERIIQLSAGPTVVFANPTNGKDAIDYLRQQGLTVIVINPTSVDTIYSSILTMGQALGSSAEAESVVAGIQEGIAEISGKLAGVSEKPTIAHIMDINPYFVSGSNTFQDELFQLAGAVNAFAYADGWDAVTLEKLLVADPQIIVTDPGYDMGTGGDDGMRQAFYQDARLKTLTAVKNDDVYVIDADIFDRGGPRVVEALQSLVKITHPELFGDAKQSSNVQQSPGFGIAAVITGLCGAVLLLRRHEKQ